MDTENHRPIQEIVEDMIPNIGAMLDDADDEAIHPLLAEMATVTRRYVDEEEVGRGGMKFVIRAEDKLASRAVARAFLHNPDDPDAVERFLKEVRLTAGLQHPNILPLYDIGFDDEQHPYFTMKLVTGRSLAELIREIRQGKVAHSLQELLEIFIKICDGVAYAHSRGIIHLDLKPENIQLGEFGEVLVCDWGLAKVVTRPDAASSPAHDPGVYNETTLHGHIKGSPGYMAPEQVSPSAGSKSVRTDIYALGAILYTLLCHRPPVDHDDVQKCLEATLRGGITPPRQLNPAIPAALEAVAMKALSCNPEGRYESVSALRNDIVQWMEGFITTAEEQSLLRVLFLLINRHRTMTAALVLCLSVFIGAFIQISLKKREAEQALIEARAARREALANQQKAEQSLELFRREQSQKKMLLGVASHNLGPMARSAWVAGQVEVTAAFCRLALAEGYESSELRELLARSYFAMFEFEKAQSIMQKYRDDELSPMLLQAKEFIEAHGPMNRNLPTVGFVEDQLKAGTRRAMIIALVCHINRRYPIEDTRKLLCLCIKYASRRHREPSKLRILDGKHFALDLSDMNQFLRSESLLNFPITHLNLANTRVSQPTHLTSLPLVELDISNTLITDIQPIIDIPSLRKLTVSRSLDLSQITIPQRLTIIRK